MPEERKVSLAETAIVGGVVVFGTLLALAVLTTRAAPPEVYTCPYCGAEFATEEELLAHIELDHPELLPPSGEILEITWKRCTGADVWYSASNPMPEYTDIIHRFKVRNTGDTTTSFKVGYYRTDYGAGWYYSKPIDIKPGEEGYIEWVFWTGEAGTYTTTWYLFGDDIEVDSMTVTTIVS